MAAMQMAFMMEMDNVEEPADVRIAMQKDSVFVLITRNRKHIASYRIDNSMEPGHQEEVFRDAIQAIRQA